MKKINRKGVVLALSLLLTGCANGVLFNNGLYSHTVLPLTFNREPTTMLSDNEAGRGDIKHVQYLVSIEFGTNGIGDVAKKRVWKPFTLLILKNEVTSLEFGNGRSSTFTGDKDTVS